ncbi:MAG: hypothetical protein HYX88_01730 [Chloroflexi bacterium]|nr:hypothetical protein [Chloroflexota bacterium]
MWTYFRTASNLVVAEMWKELLEGEGISCRLVVTESDYRGELATYRILIPTGKEQVVEEVLRNC